MDTHLVTTAERLLSTAWQGAVRVQSVETLREGSVHRLHLRQAPQGSPATAVVKTARPEPGLPVDPGATSGNPAQPLLEEWAGLAFLQGTGLFPQFYGGDRSSCLVVFEDFGAGDSLVDTLRRDDAELARRRLQDHARALAGLHGATIGREEEYRRLRDTLGPAGVPRDWKRYGIVRATQGWGDLRVLRQDLERSFAHLGQRVGGAFWCEYDTLVETIHAPSPFRAYVHSDSCPDNVLFTADGVRLIDTERGGFHFCLLDAAYCRMSMPHCFWAGRVPPAVVTAVETVYRQTLAPNVPEVTDDAVYGPSMAAACAYWILSNGTWLVDEGFEADVAWGPATWRQRVFLRLAQFAATCEEFGAFPAMADAAHETIRRLLQHWEFQDVPLFPAFAGQG